ncbi:MAG TPA: class I SAM-dependent methyltransferase [Bacteroidia bacterium]|nr:class I SAM-dependent methyltransferase [Bacteroidia bacterium]
METIASNSKDQKTADAFASSWNNLPAGSVYTKDQFEDWFTPVTKADVSGKTVLELGCGNGSLLYHIPSFEPASIEGVDLGDSVHSCEKNMARTGYKNFRITRGDLTKFIGQGYDFVYCIGVLHHLKKPIEGFESVLRNTKSGGRFHCWVYAKEGNGLIIYLVDPIRKVASKLPWWGTKYLVATPLVVPYFIYAKIISQSSVFKKLPLYEYSCWISKREFSFFRHVAFDQLVTPQTAYISKQTIKDWLNTHSEIDRNSTYIISRNGNSWKFGGKKI